MNKRETLHTAFASLLAARALLRMDPPPPDMLAEVELLLEETTRYLRKMLNINRWPEPTTDEPDWETLEEWMLDGACEATDGCLTEPDGTCMHGHPSWLLRLGLI